MKKRNLILGSLITASVFASQTAVFAMPADIEEAVTSSDYNAYDHTGDYSGYDDSELISIGEDYVATANAMIRVAPFGDILGRVTPGERYYVVGECPDCMWYKISGDVTGYVYASYMVPASEYVEETNSNSEVGEVIRSLNMYMTVEGASEVNIRTEPSRSGAIAGLAKKAKRSTLPETF